MTRVKQAAPGDFPKLLEEWKTLFPEGENYLEGRPENALRWMFAVWLVKDTDGFIKTATAPHFDYSHWSAQVLVRLMPEKAAEMLFGTARGELDEYFINSAGEELAEHHPDLYLKMNPEGTIDLTPGTSNDDWETAVANLAKTDAVAAANACLKSKYGDYYPSQFAVAIRVVAAAWKTGDPPMLEWVNGIADPKLRNIASHAQLCALAEKDPRAALAELHSAKLEVENDLRYDAPREILAQFAKVDPVGALKLMKDVEGIFSKYPRDPFAEPSAEEQAANPFSQLRPQSDNVDDNGVRDAILTGAGEKLPDDPNQLLGALHQLGADMGGGDSIWKRGVEAGLIRLKCDDWSADECLTVASLWVTELNGTPDDETLQKLAARAAHVNPEQALTALDQLPESARPSFAAEIIKQFQGADPEQNIALFSHLTAAQWDEKLGEALGRNPEAYAEAIASLPADTTLKARKSFMEKWGEQDPEAAATWLGSLPDDAASKPAAMGLAHAWAKYDEYTASNWAASLPAGPSRDAVAASLSYSFAKNQPDEAWQWASSISDAAARDEAIVDLDYKWQFDAPQKFRAALDKARRARGMSERGPKPAPDPNDPFR